MARMSLSSGPHGDRTNGTGRPMFRVVSYRTGDGRVGKTAVNPAEYAQLRKSGRLVREHGGWKS
jgi:hypothetical protein